MAAHGARRLLKMNANLNVIIGVEYLCAAQGIEFRDPLKTSPALQAALKCIRNQVPAIKQDRFLAEDIKAISQMVKEGKTSNAAGLPSSIDDVAA